MRSLQSINAVLVMLLFVAIQNSANCQNQEYSVSQSEYEDLKKSSDKLSEIESLGFEIVVRENSTDAVDARDSKPNTISEKEFSQYQAHPNKMNEFQRETNGIYRVQEEQKSNSVVKSSLELSDSDLKKLELEKSLKKEEAFEYEFVPMRERSGSDRSNVSNEVGTPKNSISRVVTDEQKYDTKHGGSELLVGKKESDLDEVVTKRLNKNHDSKVEIKD